MRARCPYCEPLNKSGQERPKILRVGRFRRQSDSRIIQRYRCLACQKGFSSATASPCFRQKKRHKNEMLRRLLCSGVSQRRIARILCLNRKTVVRKLLFLSARSQVLLESSNRAQIKALNIEFDDLETFEHTKCKPLSITLAVEAPTRRVLGFAVSKMPAKGKLAAIARRKYGKRCDERPKGRAQLFQSLKDLIEPQALIKSDENPHYPRDVKRHFPGATHKTFKGRRGAIVGQGELKKIGFDPLFCLNHTCAKFRADINRLFRKTWCTTKRPDRLLAHITVYAVFHNQSLAL